MGAFRLQTVLQTREFSVWKAATAATLGHHRSRLIRGSAAFAASYRQATVAGMQVLHLRGRGALELDREQVGAGVLWIPLQGVMQERLNGIPLEIAPGQALLIRPGDQLIGRSAETLEGLSLLLPADFVAAELGHLPAWLPPGSAARLLIGRSRRLVQALQHQDPAASIAAQELLDTLVALQGLRLPPLPTLRRSQQQRWQLVQEASSWMAARLAQPFRVGDLSAALGCPTRSLQEAFRCELGRSPLVQARLLRLQGLRQLLQDPEQRQISIATAMGRCGLLACGATARAYAGCYGERPSQTRARCLARWR